jgi:hypothetical protein
MVHITNCKKAEVVLFGADQELKTPLFARAGNNIIVSGSPGSDRITICRFEVGHEDQRKAVSTKVQDVIRAMTEFGATFPDVNQFLVEADHQQNLAGHLEIDALPRAGRTYEPPDQGIIAKRSKHKNPVGNAEDGPNMFAVGQDKKAKKKVDDEDPGKDDDSQTDAVSKSSKAADLDGDKPASASAAPKPAASGVAAPGDPTQSIKQASQADASGSKTAVKTAGNETDAGDAPTTNPPPASRWSFWKLFKFGGGDVSGNQEP